MMGIDTDVCIGILNGNIEEEFIHKKSNNEELCITAQTVFELFRGVYKRQFGKNPIPISRYNRELEILQKFIRTFHQIPFDFAAGKLSAKIYEELRGQGLDIGPFDCQIAASLISSGIFQIMTRNQKHYEKISQLSIIPI
jgi:predicted nucleic acid-binding protein